VKNTTAIAIGGFDGMHIGHQHLFNELGDNGTIVVIETQYANLTPKRTRQNYTSYPIFYLKLEDIRSLDGKAFIALLKETFPALQKIVVGYDFYFGKDRKYSFNDLKTLFDGEVVVVEEVKYNTISIHSRTIRTMIQQGDIKGANTFLGHYYTLSAKHVQGQGIGKKELVATLNVEVEDFLIPKDGVYVTLSKVDDEKYFHPSISFVGYRVSTDNKFAIETHILDGEILCKENVTISFIAYLRENKKFENLSALKSAIQKDIVLAKKELELLEQ